MLQKMYEAPSRSNLTDLVLPDSYKPRSKRFPLNNEKTLWKKGSALGNSTFVPTGTISRCGMNCLSFCIRRYGGWVETTGFNPDACRGDSHITTSDAPGAFPFDESWGNCAGCIETDADTSTPCPRAARLGQKTRNIKMIKQIEQRCMTPLTLKLIADRKSEYICGIASSVDWPGPDSAIFRRQNKIGFWSIDDITNEHSISSS